MDDTDESSLAISASSSEPLLPIDETPRKRPALVWRPFWKRNDRRIAIASVVTVLLLLIVVGWQRRHSRRPTLEEPAAPLLVTLPGYGTFKGVRVVKTIRKKKDIEQPVDAWLNVQYSTQPVNENRFAPPDWPQPFEGTRDATDYGPACMQNWGFDAKAQGEDCLNFNLFRPSGIPLETKLPVLVWLHGGAFVGGSARHFDGPTFVARSQEPIIVVTVQYRLGVLGSFPSKLFEEEGLLNLGIRDQRMLLEFMQRYLPNFGGDPDRVTLGGQSAGAHSVGIHLFHSYGGDESKKLFSQAILASGAPTARSFPPAQYPLYERQFQQLMDHLKCPISGHNSDMLACLRGTSLPDIQAISSQIFKSTTYNITWPWQPVSPGPLLEKLGSRSGIDGTFFKIPVLVTSCTDEGTFFAPKNLTTDEHFTKFMANLLPGLTDADLAELATLYPDPSDGTGPYVKSPHSTQWARVSAAFGDYSYICPVQETAVRLASAGAPVYKARFNVPNGGSDVPHAADNPYFNGLTSARHQEVADIYSSYYASFIAAGDPNKFASEGAPSWDRYWNLGSGELAVSTRKSGGISMEEERAGIRMKQCAWWRDEERMVRIHK